MIKCEKNQVTDLFLWKDTQKTGNMHTSEGLGDSSRRKLFCYIVLDTFQNLNILPIKKWTKII